MCGQAEGRAWGSGSGQDTPWAGPCPCCLQISVLSNSAAESRSDPRGREGWGGPAVPEGPTRERWGPQPHSLGTLPLLSSLSIDSSFLSRDAELAGDSPALARANLAPGCMRPATERGFCQAKTVTTVAFSPSKLELGRSCQSLFFFFLGIMRRLDSSTEGSLWQR